MSESSDRIIGHAGLGEASSNAFTISAATERGDLAQIDAATADLIAALADFNHELNGAVPWESLGGRDDAVPRQIAYALAESVRMPREAGAVEQAEAVETAWLAVPR